MVRHLSFQLLGVPLLTFDVILDSLDFSLENAWFFFKPFHFCLSLLLLLFELFPLANSSLFLSFQLWFSCLDGFLLILGSLQRMFEPLSVSLLLYDISIHKSKLSLQKWDSCLGGSLKFWSYSHHQGGQRPRCRNLSGKILLLLIQFFGFLLRLLKKTFEFSLFTLLLMLLVLSLYDFLIFCSDFSIELPYVLVDTIKIDLLIFDFFFFVNESLLRIFHLLSKLFDF